MPLEQALGRSARRRRHRSAPPRRSWHGTRLMACADRPTNNQPGLDERAARERFSSRVERVSCRSCRASISRPDAHDDNARRRTCRLQIQPALFLACGRSKTPTPAQRRDGPERWEPDSSCAHAPHGLAVLRGQNPRGLIVALHPDPLTSLYIAAEGSKLMSVRHCCGKGRGAWPSRGYGGVWDENSPVRRPGRPEHGCGPRCCASSASPGQQCVASTPRCAGWLIRFSWRAWC
jgi:hypothetical protein